MEGNGGSWEETEEWKKGRRDLVGHQKQAAALA